MYIKIKSLAAAYKFNQNFCGKKKLRSKNTKNKNQLIKSNRSKIALRGDSYHVRLIRQKKKKIVYVTPDLGIVICLIKISLWKRVLICGILNVIFPSKHLTYNYYYSYYFDQHEMK